MNGGGTFEDEQVRLGGESEGGYEITAVNMTAGARDNNGKPFNSVHMINKDTGVPFTIQVVASDSNKGMRDGVMRTLANGTYEQQQSAKLYFAREAHLENIKKSNMDSQLKGNIWMPLSNADKTVQYSAEWYKDQESGKYYASINGKPLNNGQFIQGEDEMALVLESYMRDIQTPKE